MSVVFISASRKLKLRDMLVVSIIHECYTHQPKKSSLDTATETPGTRVGGRGRR